MHILTKQVGESYTTGWDFTNRLPAGTTVVSGVCVATDSAGATVTASVLLPTNGNMGVLGNVTTIKVTAGTLGERYRVQGTITLSNGDILQEVFQLRVDNK